MTRALFLLILIAVTPVTLPDSGAADYIDRRTINDGQLVLEDVPEIPAGLAESLGRYQRARSTSLVGWALDGKSLYVKTRVGGVNQLHHIAKPDAALQQLTNFEEPIREVTRQHNGKLLAFTMDSGGSAFDQIYILNPDTKETRLLTDGVSLNNRMVWDKPGQRLAYRSTRRNGKSNDIWIMDIDFPDQARLIWEAPDGALWKPISFSRDGKLLLVQQYQAVTDSRIHLLDLTSGRMKELVGHPDYETSNVAIDFDGQDNGVFFVSNQRGLAAEIGWAPLDTSQETIFVASNIPWDVTEFELSADGKRGAFVTNENGISRLYLFDAEKLQYERVERTKIGVISDLRFSPDSRRLGISLSGPTSPGDVYTLSLGRFFSKSRRLKQWTRDQESGLDPDTLVTPDVFSFAAPGSKPDIRFNIPGFVYQPEGKGPFPVVVYVHGGPESQFRPGYNSTVQIWANQLGVAVVAPNIRGSLGYGRKYLSLDDGRLREDAVADIGYLLDWIKEDPHLDETRVAVFGASYGGYMALATAVHYSDRLVAAVDRAGISNFVTYLENTQGYRRDMRRSEYGDERDPEMRSFLESISPLNNVEKIKIPLLIVQGENDPVVPVTESEQMVTALRDQGQTVWYMNALNEGHGYEKKENRDIYQQVTYMFLKKYLMGDAP